MAVEYWPGRIRILPRAQSGHRKVLYYYDAMNPQHHYDKPGKAPDGMDLVPQYSDDSPNRNVAQQAVSQLGHDRRA